MRYELVMPRLARIDAPGALHHIMARGMDRQKIFRSDTDRKDFVLRLGTIITQSRARCFAWALLPNHFHLLLQTGDVPLASVMRRLMTGYAVKFNHRHHRHGHLFQNRYKSYLCDKDAYFLELVRYIHLNPLRAGVVKDLPTLALYAYAGHGAILGQQARPWQSIGDVLALFGNQMTASRRRYLQFVQQGVSQGHREDLTGGGLVRSAGGWTRVRSLRRKGVTIRSDERILGDSDFVTSVLARAREALDRKYALASEGIDFDAVLKCVARRMALSPMQIKMPSKIRRRVKARSLLCFWAARELGLTMTDLAKRLNLTVSAVSIAVRRGEQLALETGWQLKELMAPYQRR